MEKTVVTHFAPDLDAISALWLVRRFLPGWSKVKVKFIPIGQYTLDERPVDSQPDVFHVDTGGGRFDHHQTNKNICAASLVWEYIKRETGKKDEAVERLVRVVNEVDHARDLAWPEPDNDRYEMMLHLILEGSNQAEDRGSVYQRVVEFGLLALDGVYQMYQGKVVAEEALKKGQEFPTRWGKSLALKTKNEIALFLGEKKGYCLVVGLDSQLGHLKIYARWDRGVDLTRAYHELKKADPGPSWFLHASKCILTNGTPAQPDYRPTKLALNQIVQILKKA